MNKIDKTGICFYGIVKHLLRCSIVFLLSIGTLTGQYLDSVSYYDRPIAIADLEGSSFEEAKKEVRLGEIEEIEEIEEIDQELSIEAEKGLVNFLTILGVVIALALFVFLLLKLTNNTDIFSPKDRKVKANIQDLSLDEIEDNLENTDVFTYLQQAINNGNFTLALRLHYLQILKTLSEEQHITWKKDKTNGEYVGEMQAHSLADDFRQLTNMYERYWYGDRVLTKEDFFQIEPLFKHFNT